MQSLYTIQLNFPLQIHTVGEPTKNSTTAYLSIKQPTFLTRLRYPNRQCRDRLPYAHFDRIERDNHILTKTIQDLLDNRLHGQVIIFQVSIGRW